MNVFLRYGTTLAMLLYCFSLTAQETVPFSTRHEVNNIKGNVIMTGNDIVGALIQSGSTTYSSPNDPYNETQNNGNYVTAFIDIDEDPTTFSSSSADLNAPDNDCSKLVYAGLYWSANYYMQRGERPNIYADPEISSDVDTNVNFVINNGPLAMSYEARYADFDNDNSDIRLNPVTSYLVLTQPVNGCNITNLGMLAGNIAVISDGGGCSIREKVVNAQNAGAVGVVIVSDTDMMPQLIGDGPTINIPTVSIGNDDISNRTVTGGNLITLMQSSTEVILATLSTEGNSLIDGLPLIDPRKQGPADFRDVKLKLPNNTNYIDITASSVVFDGYRDTPTNPLGSTANDEVPYVCYADITNLLDPNNYFGTYTLADMNATQGYTSSGDGACGGWFIVAIYENPNESSRYISTKDGYAQVFRDAAPIDFAYSGFTTSGGNESIDVRYGISSLEGDTSLGGDQLRIQNTSGTFIALGGGTSVNPVSNFFNGSISEDDQYITARVPASQNTQGFDVDIFNLDNDGNGLIGNGQSSARFQIVTNSDRYSVFFNTLSVSLGDQPELQVIERVYNADGTIDITDQQVDTGDELLFDLAIENTGNENFVDGSVVVNVGLNDNLSLIAVQDATLPQGITYFEVSSGILEFYIPADIVEANIDQPIHIRFKTRLVATCEDLRDTCSNSIQNTTTAGYTGALTGIAAQTTSVSSIDNCGIGNGEPASVTLEFPICQQELTSCYGNLTLVAKNGYTQYTWSGPGISTPVVTSVNFFDVPDPQSGVYTVIKEDTNPSDGVCITSTQEFVVTIQGDGELTNPVLDYVDGISVITNNCSGLVVPTIQLCSNESFFLETNFNNLSSISWQRLAPSGACISDPNDQCSLLSGDCTDVNWVEEPNGNIPDFTVTEDGDYRILVELESGCFIPFYFSVDKKDYQPELTMTPIGCGNDGSVTVTNVPDNFAFSLTPSGSYTNTTGVFAIFSPGDITVYARDMSFPGCEYTATINVPSIDPQFNVTADDPFCANDDNGTGFGRIHITVIGGIPEYQYTISSPSLGAADPIVVPNSSANNGNYIQDNLPPGTYNIEIISNRPAPECTFNTSVTINPAVPIVIGSSTVTDISCSINGNTLGTIEVNDILGGVPPYRYSLFKDQNLANTSIQNPFGPSTATSISFNDLDFGQYLLRITDANNCSIDSVYEVGFVPSLNVSVDSSNSCTTGVVLNVSMTGGAGPFEIREYPNGTFIPFNGLPVSSGSPNERNHQFSGLNGGSIFEFEVLDSATGCTEVRELDLSGVESDINFTATVVDPQCANEATGSISITVTNGTSDFIYSIYNSSGTILSSEVSTFDSYTFNGLYAGTYTVEVTSGSENCSTSQSITLTDPPVLFISAAITKEVSCDPGNDAEVTLEVQGGAPPYLLSVSYASDPIPFINSNIFSTFYVVTDLAPGSYNLAIQDNNGCITNTFIDINGPKDITNMDLTLVGPNCNGDTSGSATVNATTNSSSSNLFYRISAPAAYATAFSSNNEFYNLVAGIEYTFEATTSDGCSSTITGVLQEPSTLDVAVFTDNNSCFESNDGMALVTISGGTPPYSFAISNEPGRFYNDSSDGNIGQHIFGDLSAGDYEIFAQDANGCSVVNRITITQPDRLFIEAITTPSSVTVSDGSIMVNVTGGTGPFEYAIRDVNGQTVFPFQSGNLFNGLSAGDYTIVVRDNNICQEETIVTVNEDQANPLVTYADEILTCAVSGVIYPVIYIEDESGEAVEIDFEETLSIVWQKLDDITCTIELEDNCPTTDSSCESSWFEVGNGSNYTVLEEGEYRVIIEFANKLINGSRTYYFRVEDQTLSIDDTERKDFTFYPNPADSFIVLSDHVEAVVIYDVTGKKVQELTVVNELNVSALNKGVYFLKMKSSDGNEVIKKLIKN